MNLHDTARETLLKAVLALADRGFLAGVGGNLALRIDADTFAVTPSATDYYSMTPDDICVLRLDTLAVLAGNRPPSVESGLHARLLRRRPDCRASVHTHQPVASAYSLLHRPLPVPARWQPQLGKTVPVCGYAPSGTGWLAWRAAAQCGGRTRALLMANHGVLGLGRDLADASEVVIALEQAATDWFARTLATARAPHRHAVLTALHTFSPFPESTT